MLQTGRLKDLARIDQFVEHGVVDRERLLSILAGHGLTRKWKNFCKKDLL